jgi:ABC-type polar amino acid transport system ATPase subunit
MLKIKNFKKAFGSKKVLDNISVDIPTGSIAVFLGESGVGKSTLLRVLNGLEILDSGSVTLDSKALDLENINMSHQFGMVFQQFNLFSHLTNKQNITLALEKSLKKSKLEAGKIADQLLKKYGLLDKASKYPSQLSGGQKQRLALARSLALRPKAICLDEPTSALDPMLTNSVVDSINQLAKDGLTVLIATHDVAILSKLDCTIYLMDGGKIIESATAAELRANPKTYSKISNFIKGA